MHEDGLAKGTFRKDTQEFCAKISWPRTHKLCTFLAQPFYTCMRVLYSSGTENMFTQTNWLSNIWSTHDSVMGVLKTFSAQARMIDMWTTAQSMIDAFLLHVKWDTNSPTDLMSTKRWLSAIAKNATKIEWRKK